MATTVFWDDSAASLDRQAAEGLRRVAQEFKRHTKKLIGIQGPPRSLPGEPPHKDTKKLHDTFYAQMGPGALHARSGSHQEYAWNVEYGDSNAAPRPYIRPASAYIEQQFTGIVVRVLSF